MDDPYVVRGGWMTDPTVLIKSARGHWVKSGKTEWAVSMNCLPGRGLMALVRAARLDNDWVRVTRLGCLARAGYEYRPDVGSPRGHGNLILTGEPTAAEANRIAQIFAPGGPSRHPGKGGRIANPVSLKRRLEGRA